MKSKTIDTWKKFGKEDPYYGVLSDEKYRLSNLTSGRVEEFFETGRAYVRESLKRIENIYKSDLSEASILDFGCGVGRIAIPFSRITSKKVVGIDVSAEILEKARSHAQELKATNVEFLVYDGKKLPVTEQFDFINSYIVLQHIERNIGLRLIKQLLERAKPGGLLQLQVTYGNTLPRHKYAHYYLRSKYSIYNKLYSFLKNRNFRTEPMMQMNNYDPKVLLNLFANYTSSVNIEFTDHGGFLGASYLMRREF